MKTTSYLEEPNRHFCQHFMRRTTQQTLSAINLASKQKTTKLFFSSQVRKQFKLLAVPFKSLLTLRCCLRSDKLMSELPCFKILQRSVNQIVLFYGFLSDFDSLKATRTGRMVPHEHEQNDQAFRLDNQNGGRFYKPLRCFVAFRSLAYNCTRFYVIFLAASLVFEISISVDYTLSCVLV